ncbi:amino acid permease [Paenibacillus sp. FJAT-27812]|uniref:amino acid permease n=1 Tax=Paenibacillus sp. FJAT-27812 TaxID=1684143 RepID=UPI0006A7D563|nr:amino acid permease [Paenibacillus sp. FJAT-27812]
MMQVMAGVMLLAAVFAAIILGARKAQQSIQSSKYQSMLKYGLQTQLLQDKHELHRFGLAQQLRRRWGGLSAFGLSFNTMALIGGAAFLFGPATGEGGPSVIGFGFPMLALFALAVSASLAELASAVPTAGGIHHAASALGGRKWGWRTGWLHLLGHLAMLSLMNCAFAALLEEFLSARFGYEAAVWSFWCLAIFITVLQAAINHWGSRSLSIHSAGGVMLQVIVGMSMLAGLVWLFWPGGYSPVLLYQLQNAEWNGTVHAGASISGTMLLLKLFVGLDGAAHGAEETIEPRIRVPWAIYLSTAYTFVVGFILFSFILLSVTRMEGSASMGLFLQAATASWGGSSIVVFLVFLSLWSSGLQSMTLCSRILFSLARDEALPMSKRWSAVSVKLQVPVQAVWLSACLSLIMLVTAFLSNRNETVLLLTFAIVCLNLSYAVPIALKLKRRKKDSRPLDAPWHLGGWSTAVNGIALA